MFGMLKSPITIIFLTFINIKEPFMSIVVAFVVYLQEHVGTPAVLVFQWFEILLVATLGKVETASSEFALVHSLVLLKKPIVDLYRRYLNMCDFECSKQNHYFVRHSYIVLLNIVIVIFIVVTVVVMVAVGISLSLKSRWFWLIQSSCMIKKTPECCARFVHFWVFAQIWVIIMTMIIRTVVIHIFVANPGVTKIISVTRSTMTAVCHSIKLSWRRFAIA